jgi:putative transposase
MSSKNTIREHVPEGFFHVYNRGVEKREIFLDDSDCRIFLYYFSLYLSAKEDLQLLKQKGLRLDKIIKNNLSEEVDLLVYALMPNHFHLLVQQHSSYGVMKLMKRVTTAYAMYFNKKYSRVGPLFQGIYKSVYIHTDEYLLHLSRYIHLNPLNIQNTIDFNNYTSYSIFLGKRRSKWVKSDKILQYFHSNSEGNQPYNSYQSFVEDYSQPSQEILGELILED